MRAATFRLLPLAAIAALAACNDDDDPVTPPPSGDAAEFRRLLVTDTLNFARLYDLTDGARVDSMGGLPGRVTYLYSAQGRVAFAHFQRQNRVAFVDGGVYEQGGRGVRQAPRILGWHDDQVPIHGNTNGGIASAHFDASGNVKFWREASVAGGTTTPLLTVNTGTPHHGAGMAFGDGQLVSASVRATTGSSPDGVYVYDLAGALVDSTRTCPGLHGLAGHSGGVMYGCADGALLATTSGGRASFAKVTNPADPAFGVGTVWAREGQPRFLVRMSIRGASPVSTANRRIGIADPATREMRPIDLPELDWTADIDHAGRWALVLGRSGTLHVADMTTRQVVGTLPDAVPPMPSTGVVLTPHFAFAEGLAYLTSPTRGEVLEIALSASGRPSIVRRIATGGVPERVLVLGVRHDAQLAAR